MSPNPAAKLLRLEIALVSCLLLSGLSLAALFSSALFGIEQLSFQLFWNTHLFFHCLALTFSLTLIIHVIRELSDGVALFYLGLFFSLCLLVVLSSFLPWISHHAVFQELALARSWLRVGSMVENPLLLENSLPGGIVPVYLAFFQHHLTFLLAPYHASYALLLAGLVTVFVYYKTHDEELSIWASMLLLSCPFLVATAGQPSNVLPTSCFFGLAYGSAIVWGEQKGRWYWGIVPGLALGFACFLGAVSFFLGASMLIALVGFYLAWKFSLTRTLLSVLGILASAFLAMGPWLFRNFIWSGKPFHPLFENGPPSFADVPISPEWSLGLLFLVIAVIPVFKQSRHLHRVAPWARATWFVFLFGVLFSWRVYSRDMEELLLPLILPMLLLAAVGMEQVIERKQGNQGAALLRGLLTVHLLASLTVSILSGGVSDSIAYLIGRTAKSDYLEDNLPGYSVARQLNKTMPATAGIFLIGADVPAYYVKRPILGSTRAGEVLEGLLQQDESGRAFAQQLLLLGVSHLVVGANPATNLSLPLLSSKSQGIWQRFLLENTEKVEVGDDVSVLRVVSSGGVAN